MPSYEITDFKNGMDLRKLYATAPAGSLRVLRNAVITAGAEIEKRAASIYWNTASSTSLGLLSRDGLTYVVQNAASGITIPPDQDTLGLINIPYGAHTFDYVADWDLFDGDFYIVMHDGVSGAYVHYYRQLLVTDAAAKSKYIRTYRDKMYGLDGRLLRFSAIGDPKKWTPPASGTTADGSGFIDLSAQDADSTELIGMEAYYDQMAIFSSLSSQFWKLDPDPANNSFQQLLRQTGLVAPHAVTQFGSGDVMYLSPYGFRSLRIQNLSLTAGTTDVGSPIDVPVRRLLWDQGGADNQYSWFRPTRTLIQPRTGRLWMILPDRTYVLSTFQEPAITAWSEFIFQHDVVESCISDPYIMMRASDHKIYKYGGNALDQYDNSLCEIITPALSMDNPADMKTIQGFDVACAGTWRIYASYDPNNEAAEELVATVTNNTFRIGDMTMPGWATHISLRFRTNDLSNATLGKALVHYEKGKDD